MATVVLVGAGATVAEALPGRPKRSMQPPLDATFFALCSRAHMTGISTVRNYTETRFGIDPFSGAYSMEGIFGFVYSDLFSSPRPTGALDAYWALLRMYSASIAQTTNRLSGTARTGVGALLRALWMDDKEITFVTFNQDLVIEKAIEAAASTAAYGDIPWNLLSCYDGAFKGFIYPLRGKSFRTRGDRVRVDRSLQIHKLHGSLNWVWRAATREDARNSLPRPGNEVYCLTAERVEGDLRLEDESTNRYLIPLVVPPVYEKGPHYRKFLAPVWGRA